MQVNEGKPEHSINWAPGAVSAYVGLQTGPNAPTSGHTVVADESGVWGADLREVPFDPMPLTRLNGDPWTTTHGGLGLELASFIGEIDTATWCAAVAATTSTDLAGNVWASNAHCAWDVVPNLQIDGAAMQADLGARALYFAYASLFMAPAGNLRRFWPCIGANVGDPTECPSHWVEPIMNVPPIAGHANVVVNPCTHHPIFLARDTEDQVRYMILDTGGNLLDTDGNPATDGTVLEVAPNEKNSNCQGEPCPSGGDICACGGTGGTCGEAGCWDITSRVHAATHFDPVSEECRLYAAYDYSDDSTGDTVMKARLHILDITDEENIVDEHPTVESTEQGVSEGWNEFSATVAADYFTDGVGFFFYRQDSGNACTTTFRAMLSDDGGNTFSAPLAVSPPFRSVRSNYIDGLGHYIEASGFSEPGWLFASWSQTIETATPCLDCEGTPLSVATFGARMSP